MLYQCYLDPAVSQPDRRLPQPQQRRGWGHAAGQAGHVGLATQHRHTSQGHNICIRQRNTGMLLFTQFDLVHLILLTTSRIV